MEKIQEIHDDQAMAKICYEDNDTTSKLCREPTSTISGEESERFQKAMDLGRIVLPSGVVISIALMAGAAMREPRYTS